MQVLLATKIEVFMGYTKELLIEILESCLGSGQVSSLGLPRSVEELAVLMFLKPDKYSKCSIEIIKDALTDLRSVGLFQWKA
jgi:ubiquinone biosynthesis protein COQ9